MDMLVLLFYFGLPLAMTFSIAWFMKGRARNVVLCLVMGLIIALFMYSLSDYLRLSYGSREGGMDAYFDDESALFMTIFSMGMGISAAIGALASFTIRYFASRRSKAANLQGN